MLVANDPDTLDPRYAVDAVALRTTRLVHAGLVRCDPDTLAPLPYLARGWRWVDPLTLRVELREGLRFHSGAPFDARDVVATLRAFGSPEVSSRHARVVDAILSAEPDGPYAVVVTMRRPHATLVTDLELPILRADEAASAPRPDGTLDGLGPFRVAHFSHGEVLLEPAAGGAMSAPLHAVSLRTVHDENARALRLFAGRADVALNVLSPTLLPAVEKERGLAIFSRPGSNLTYLVARTDRGVLGDARARRAVSLAVDRAEITRTLLAGRAVPATTLIPPSHWAHTAAPLFPRDVDGARAALAQAGITDAHLTLLTSTDRLRGSIARTLAQELAEVGIVVSVVPLELGTMIARLNAGDFDLAVLQLPEIQEPNVLRVFMHSASIPPAGANRGRIRDPEVDALLDEGDRTPDIEVRRAIYAKLEARVRQEMLMIPLWHEDQVVVTSERARSFVPSAEGRWLGLASLP